MSYSFNVRAATAALALAAVAAELDKVVAGQPVHAADKDQALAAATAFVGVIPTDETKDVYVSMSGSLSGHWQGNTIERITGASVSAHASLVDRPAA